MKKNGRKEISKYCTYFLEMDFNYLTIDGYDDMIWCWDGRPSLKNGDCWEFTDDCNKSAFLLANLSSFPEGFFGDNPYETIFELVD